jgi:hypothetical protein
MDDVRDVTTTITLAVWLALCMAAVVANLGLTDTAVLVPLALACVVAGWFGCRLGIAHRKRRRRGG